MLRSMKCPACRDTALDVAELEPGLSSMRCASCSGNFIGGAQYWDWLREKVVNVPEVAGVGPVPQVVEVERAKTCPSCGRMLTKYRVGHGLGFMVEHCAGCDGVWLDANEWEALKARNLHDDLQLICDSLWQGQVLKEELRELAEARFARVLGSDYEKAKQVRAWIEGHPSKAMLVAFLVEQGAR